MPRGRPLSPYEQGQIVALHEQGLSMRGMAKQLGRSLCVVQNFLKNRENYGKLKTTGRPKVLSAHEIRLVARKASNSMKSALKIKEELKLQASKSTILRAINAQPNLIRAKLKKIPCLTKEHKIKRKEFERNNMATNWHQVIFTDEKKFNLDGPDGFNCYWRDLRKEPLFFSKRNFGGGSLMVWAGFSSHGTLELYFPSTRMNSLEYQNILSECLLPYLAQNADKAFTFQQDNAAIHVSKSTKQWFEEHNIELLDWPARSPDLNPMENLWGLLVRNVYAENRQYQTKEELKVAICNSWREIRSNVLENLVNSMPSPIFKTIEVNGNCIN